MRRRLLIAGIAEGLGLEIAAAFAESAYDVVGLSRTDRASAQVKTAVEERGGRYIHLRCDLSRPDEVSAALRTHAEQIDTLIHNAQSLMIRPFADISPGDFEQVWRNSCLGAIVSAQAVIPYMAARKSGAVIFTGATAGLRGGANFSAFASAKFALRGLAQALAREFGPNGIHVAHVVIDGLIDTPASDRRFGPAQSARMDAGAIAKAYLAVALQPPSAWTHEIDLRPRGEKF